MMNFRFPLYAMRGYNSIEIEGDYKVISTFKSRYVLDEAYPMIGTTYEQRRLNLLRRDLPYKLYPLSIRLENVSDILTVRPSTSIDADGKLLKLNLKDAPYRKVYSGRIVASYVSEATGDTMFYVKDCEQPFKVRQFGNSTYARYIKLGKLYVLFDLSEEKRPVTRVKL